MTTISCPRVHFISGPLGGRLLPTRIPQTGCLDVYKDNIHYPYRIEAVGIAGEAVLIGLLDDPEVLPAQVQSALDLIEFAQHHAVDPKEQP